MPVQSKSSKFKFSNTAKEQLKITDYSHNFPIASIIEYWIVITEQLENNDYENFIQLQHCDKTCIM